MLTNIIKMWPILFLGLVACQFSAPSGGPSPTALPLPSSTPTSTPTVPIPSPTLPPLPDVPDLPAGTLVKCDRKTDWQSPTAFAISPDGKTAYVLDQRLSDYRAYESELSCAKERYGVASPTPSSFALAAVFPSTGCEYINPPAHAQNTIYKITAQGASRWENDKGQCFQDIGLRLQDDNQGHLYLFLKNRLFQVSPDFNLIQEKADLSPAYRDFRSLIDESDSMSLEDLYLDQKNQIFFSLGQYRDSSRFFLSRFYRLDENGLPQPIKLNKEYSTFSFATIAHDSNRNIIFALGIFPESTSSNRDIIPFKLETLIQAGLKTENGTIDAQVLKDGRVVVIGEQNNLFLLDHKNQTIVRLAGGKYGYRDGQGTEAQFGNLIALDLDDAENIYVLDAGNKAIRKVTLAGQVTTFYRQNP